MDIGIPPGSGSGSGGLTSKVKVITRDMTAASGDVATTGIGFQPTALIAFMVNSTGVYTTFGMSDENGDAECINYRPTGTYGQTANLVKLEPATNNHQAAVVKSYDSDGFTLTWTKTSSPTGTASIVIIALK